MPEASQELGVMLPLTGWMWPQRPLEAKERRRVNEMVTTKNPVLFVGGTYDAATATYPA